MTAISQQYYYISVTANNGSGPGRRPGAIRAAARPGADSRNAPAMDPFRHPAPAAGVVRREHPGAGEQ